MKFQIGFVNQIKEIRHIHCHRPNWEVFHSILLLLNWSNFSVFSFCHNQSDGTGPMAKELNNLEEDIVAIDILVSVGPSQSCNFGLTFDLT